MLFSIKCTTSYICQSDGCEEYNKITKSKSKSQKKRIVLNCQDAIRSHKLNQNIEFPCVKELINTLFNSSLLPGDDYDGNNDNIKCRCCNNIKYRKCILSDYPYVLSVSLYYNYVEDKVRKYRNIVKRIENVLEFEEGRVKYILQAIGLHSSNGAGHYTAKIWNRFNNSKIPIYNYDGACYDGKLFEHQEDKRLFKNELENDWYNLDFDCNNRDEDHHLTPQILFYTLTLH